MQIDRVNTAYGVENDTRLSSLLGKGRSVIGKWRTRDSVPLSVLQKASNETGVALEWLLTGNGAMYGQDKWPPELFKLYARLQTGKSNELTAAEVRLLAEYHPSHPLAQQYLDLAKPTKEAAKLVGSPSSAKATVFPPSNAELIGEIDTQAIADHMLGYKVVPVLDIEASAGSGALVELEESSSYVSFTTQYLRQLGFSSPDNAHIVKIKGDSMHGTLYDGESVLVDTGVQEYRGEGIYIVRIDDLLVIKRLQKIGPKLKVISDNPHYDNFYVDETTNFSIVARFVLGFKHF